MAKAMTSAGDAVATRHLRTRLQLRLPESTPRPAGQHRPSRRHRFQRPELPTQVMQPANDVNPSAARSSSKWRLANSPHRAPTQATVRS
jgi:hypothetical protein